MPAENAVEVADVVEAAFAGDACDLLVCGYEQLRRFDHAHAVQIGYGRVARDGLEPVTEMAFAVARAFDKRIELDLLVEVAHHVIDALLDRNP